MKKTLILISLLLVIIGTISAQPQPCGATPIMSNNCADACVICDINGYVGTNNLQAGGQDIGNVFCSWPNDMHFIAFIAGSTSLSVRLDVSNCTQAGNQQSLDIGFYESLDCQNFIPLDDCRVDLAGGQSHLFEMEGPLVVGQHYYLIMDGSSGSICDWTFTVEDGSTQVSALEASGEINIPAETCPNLPTTIANDGQLGAGLYYWFIDGIEQSVTTQSIDYNFPFDGSYEICCVAANPCDEGPEICKTINVRTPETLEVNEVLCDGECLDYNGKQFCETGIYQETVTLANGCDSIININLEILPQPINDVDVWICNDAFYYIGDTGYNQTGSYSGIVLTENDCDSIVNLELLVIECEIIVSPSQIPVVCNGTSTGTLIFSVDQGELPLTFTYTNIEDTSITGTGMTNLLVNNEIPNIPAGTYFIFVRDEFGNEGVESIEVTEPEVLEISLSPSENGAFNLSCFEYYDGASMMMIPGNDGAITANLEGGKSPYSYLWSDGQMTQTADGLEAINYEVTVTDDVGCSITASLQLSSPDQLQSVVDFRDPTCDGFDTGEIEILNTSGGTGPYNYALNQTNNFDSLTLFTDLLEGDYTVFVRDSLGCVSSFIGTTVAPDIPTITFDDDLEIELCDSIRLNPILNNAAITVIEWTEVNGSTLSCVDCLTPFASPVNNNEYILSVTSADDCSATDSIRVDVSKRRRVYVANIFSPNGDGINDAFTVNAGCEVSMITRFGIYDRWGNLVFERENFIPNDNALGWDGRLNRKELQPGVYSWQAKILFIDGEELDLSEHFTLVK